MTKPLPRDGEPCDHPGCLSHISHPCESCGRIGGRAKAAPPEKIYLQCYDEAGELLDLARDDVTWCVDQINENDAVYVLAQAQEENRIRGECLEIAVEALEWYGHNCPVAHDAIVKIEDRLAQLEPEEETE